MKEAEERQSAFHECVCTSIADIRQDYESGESGLSEQAFDALIADYLSMLEMDYVLYHYRAKLLTQVEHQLLVLKMRPALKRQYYRLPLCSMVALSIQLKLSIAQSHRNIEEILKTKE